MAAKPMSKQPVTFRLDTSDQQIVQRAVAEGLYESPSKFYEFATKKHIDFLLSRYPSLSPVEIEDDDAA